ncbi:MAG: PAS domain S-box protein [Ignavibacteriaceae bacterium]|nr:PAS domain S-box protein [Ignavibacteriaceae bacterium]
MKTGKYKFALKVSIIYLVVISCVSLIINLTENPAPQYSTPYLIKNLLLIFLPAFGVFVYLFKSSLNNQVDQPVKRESNEDTGVEKLQFELEILKSKFERTFTLSPMAIVVSKFEDGTIIEINNHLCELFDYTKEQIIGKTSLEINFISEKDRNLLIDSFKSNDKVILTDRSFVTQRGKKVCYNATVEKFKLMGLDYLITSFQDITELKNAQIKIADSEDKYRTIIENQNDLIAKFDPEGYYLYANPLYCQIFERSEEELCGKTFLPLVHEEDLEAAREQMQKVLKPPYISIFEQRAKTKTGWRWFEWSIKGILDDTGKVKEVVVAGRDVTDRKEIRLALEKSEKMLNEAQRVSKTGSWELDLKTYALNWTDEVYRIFEVDKDDYERLYDAFYYSIVPEERDKVIEVYNQTLKDKLPFEMIHRIFTKNGNTKYVLERCETYYDIDGSPLRSLGTVRDITESKLTQIRLEKETALYEDLLNSQPSGVLRIRVPAITELELQNWINISKIPHSFDLISSRVLKIFEINPDDYASGDIILFDLIAEDDKAEFVKKLLECNSKLTLFSHEVKVRSGEEYKWISVEAVPRLIQSGEVLWTATISDITERKLTDLLIKESEEKFRLLITELEQGLAVHEGIFDSEGKLVNYRFIELNKSFERLTGLTKENVLGKTVLEILPGTEKYWFEKYESVMKTGESIHYQNYSKELEKHFDVVAFRNQENQFAVIITDVTEQFKIQAELKKSEEKFRTLFNDHSAIKLIIDPETGTIYDANKSAINFYGYSFEELKNMKLSEINIMDSNELKEVYKDVLKGIETHFYFKHKLKSGLIRDVEVYSSKIIIEDKEFIHGIILDVTESFADKIKIMMMSKAIEQSPISVVITDIAGKIEYLNPMMCTTTGYSHDELTGQNPRILKSGEHNQSVYKNLWATISSGKSWHGELLNKKKTGELYWEDCIISPIFNKNGEITNYVAVKEDITEKKKWIQELIAAKERAEDMNKIKSYFFANMSHELRTPLIGILGYSELMLEDYADKPDLVKIAKTINKSGERLNETLNLILNLSKFESGNMETNLAEKNIVPVIQESFTLYQVTAAQKGLDFKLECEEKEIIIKVDEILFLNILNNLINNGIKFTHKGSVTVTVKKGNGYVLIIVRDTGIGIAPENQSIIWEEFRQASEGFGRSFEGTGLGLTIAKKYTELMGGVIEIESTPEIGSAFSLRFPLLESPTCEQDPEFILPVKITYGTSNIRYSLLYVEDDFNAIDLVKIMISHKYDLDVVNDGKSALEKVKLKEYDAILMDINLRQGPDGVMTTQQIRQLQQYRETPIIAITAFAMESEKDEFLSKGLTHYLSKPFTRKELLNVIDGVFSK